MLTETLQNLILDSVKFENQIENELFGNSCFVPRAKVLKGAVGKAGTVVHSTQFRNGP